MVNRKKDCRFLFAYPLPVCYINQLQIADLINASTDKEIPPMAISRELLDILVCPKCKGEIYLNQDKDGLICENCRLLYEIRDDIPVMLIDEARPIEQ